MLEKIKRRLPGSEKATATIFALKGLINKSSNSIDKLIFKRIITNYFLGELASERYNPKIYKELENNYTEDDHFNFNGIRLPKIEKKEEKIGFIVDFLDTIYSEQFSSHCIIDEGPYQYRKVLINPGDIVIDAGANTGLFSALASHLGAIVYAFEPVKEVRDKDLKLTTQLNFNINIIPFALSNKTGTTEIDIDSNNLRGSSIILHREESKKEIISTITIDDWVKQNNIPRIDFIKADIEGAERLMLEGAKETLKNFAPKLAICTYHLPDDKEVLTDLILKANPTYKIEYKWKKLYAWV